MLKITNIFKIFALASLFTRLALGHVSFMDPCPRYSPVGVNCPAVPPGQSLEADSTAMNSPINSMTLGGTMPLCRHTTPYATPSATWTAGQSVTIKFSPHAAAHSGGHCEFSISYDNGKTFAVIHQELRYCFLGSKPASTTNTATILSYTFDLPADLPSSDKAVFAWTWVNASGNREFYMNCADVAIKGGSSSSYTGKEMTIANYPGYPTIPEFVQDYDTGLQYYTNAKQITVSPNGSGSSGKPNDQAVDSTTTASSSPSSSLAASKGDSLTSVFSSAFAPANYHLTTVYVHPRPPAGYHLTTIYVFPTTPPGHSLTNVYSPPVVPAGYHLTTIYPSPTVPAGYHLTTIYV